MFHKVNDVKALSDFKLRVQFAEGKTKIYDCKPILKQEKAFEPLKNDQTLFSQVMVDVGGYGIVWNDDIDLSCD